MMMIMSTFWRSYAVPTTQGGGGEEEGRYESPVPDSNVLLSISIAPLPLKTKPKSLWTYESVFPIECKDLYMLYFKMSCVYCC